MRTNLQAIVRKTILPSVSVRHLTDREQEIGFIRRIELDNKDRKEGRKEKTNKLGEVGEIEQSIHAEFGRLGDKT